MSELIKGTMGPQTIKLMEILQDGEPHPREELMEALGYDTVGGLWGLVTIVRKKIAPQGLMIISEYNKYNRHKPLFRLTRRIVP